MLQLRSIAGLIAVIGLSVCLFAVIPASAAQQSSATKCTQTVQGHVYSVWQHGLTCAKAKSYVKTLAAQRPAGDAIRQPPKGFKCKAYVSSKHVQTYGHCEAIKGNKKFEWTLLH